MISLYISSEGNLSKKLHKYELIIAPNRMHDLMYHASLFIGDSQTMCAEAGILGTPFINEKDGINSVIVVDAIYKSIKLSKSKLEQIIKTK